MDHHNRTKTKQNKTRQDKTNKAKQKAKQTKPKQNKEQNKTCPLTLAGIQIFTAWLHWNWIYWWRRLNSKFWFQFGWPWPSFKVTVLWELNNFCIYFLVNFSICFDEIQYAAATGWFLEAHAKFILHNILFKAGNYLIFMTCAFSSGLYLDDFKPVCSNLVWYYAQLNSTVWFQFKILDLYSRSQGYGKAKTCATILLSI